MASKGKKVGRAALSEAEKQQRKDALKAESKADRFVRLAVGDGNTGRIPKALKALDSLTKLAAGKSEYTVQQVEIMLTAIGTACEKLKNAYTGQKASGGNGFKF